MTTNPGGCDAKDDLDLDHNEYSEKLTVQREELVRGVVIKAIVSTPKTKSKKARSSSVTASTTSLNPFEKRQAPKPPSLPESVPKTKSKKRGISKS